MNESAIEHKVILRKVTTDHTALSGGQFRIFRSDLTEYTNGRPTYTTSENEVKSKGYYEAGTSGVWFIGNLPIGTYYLFEQAVPTDANDSNAGKVFVLNVTADGIEKKELGKLDTDGTYEWLIHIGASTKTGSADPQAGMFGEGFKIAALCALRDYGWEVQMSSGDWTLNVCTVDTTIDDRVIRMLAYVISDTEPVSGSMLMLHNVDPDDYALFINCLDGFYYHSLCHVFGGELSESFSYAMTTAIAIILRNSDKVERARKQWYEADNKSSIFLR